MSNSAAAATPHSWKGLPCSILPPSSASTAGNKHLRKALVEAAWHYLTCSGRPKDLAKGQAPDRVARRHAAKGVRRLVERREALLARGVHNNKANVATARELACWVWAVGLMAEEA